MVKSIKSQSLITGERLMKIETTLDFQTDKIDKLDRKMSDFIDCADKKYATKEELNSIKENIKENKTETKELRRDYVDLAIKLGMIGAAVALLTKSIGAW